MSTVAEIKRAAERLAPEDFAALAAFDGTTFVWFWIGRHDEYERLLRS